MKRITQLLVLLPLLNGLVSLPVAAETNDLSLSLVKLSVTAQEFDAYMPWQKRKPHGRSGYGIAVGPHRILTSEPLVRNGTLIEMQRPQSGERLAARVVESDHQIGLALLEVSPDVAPFTPVEVRPDRRLDADTPLQIVQLDNTLALQTGGAQVLSVEMSKLPAAPFPALLYTLLTDIAVNNQSAIVMSCDRLAGIVLQYSGNRRTAQVLPGSVIDRHGNRLFLGATFTELNLEFTLSHLRFQSQCFGERLLLGHLLLAACLGETHLGIEPLFVK